MNTKLNNKFNYDASRNTNIDMNTLISQGITGIMYNEGTNQTNLHTPLGETTSGYSTITYYNVETISYSSGSRLCQIAYSCLSHNPGMWYRIKHDANWRKWNKVSIDGHTHDNRYYTEAEVNSKIQGVENMIQITMGGVRLVGSGSIYKTISEQGSSEPYTNPWQVGVTGLPNGDFMRIVSFPFSGGSSGPMGGFNEYIVLKNSSDTYAIVVITDAGFSYSSNGGYVWYKNDNSIMLKLTNTGSYERYTWNAHFSYEIYKYQS